MRIQTEKSNKNGQSNYPLPFGRRPLIQRPKPERKRPLTVCIACICENGLIIGASDRMLTSGDIEFEPVPSSTGTSIINKFTPVSKSVVVMMAGESGLQVEILTKVIGFINKKSKETSSEPSVKFVVDAYIHFYDEIKRQRAASSILAPLGLDSNTFIVRQKELSDGFSETIARALIDFPMPIVETIITGFDGISHLYKVIGNQLECCDLIGFAAIGSGARHAESQFMSRGYCLAVPQEEALWLTYMAKRKSEVAPGVGEETDLFAISPKSGLIKNLKPAIEQMEINKIYDDFEIKQNSAFQDAQNEIKPSISDFLDKNKSSSSEPPPPSGDPPQNH